MSTAAIKCLPQFFEDAIGRWISKFKAPEVRDYIRLPTAIHAAPAVALKTENPQSAVIRIVTALSRRAAAFVIFPLPRAAVTLASSSCSQLRTARDGAGPEYPRPRYGRYSRYESFFLHVCYE